MPPYPLNIDKAVETSVNSSWEQVRMNLKSLIINPEGGVCASQKKFSLLYFSFFFLNCYFSRLWSSFHYDFFFAERVLRNHSYDKDLMFLILLYIYIIFKHIFMLK